MTRLALCLLLATLAGCKFEVCIDGSGRSCSQDNAKSCEYQAGSERQLSPHEQENNGPTPAGAPGRWIDERYEL